jgi:hypothetical protein
MALERGCDAATRWLADKRPEGAVCLEGYNTASGARYWDSFQRVRSTDQLQATRSVLSSQNETTSRNERDIPRVWQRVW